MYAFPCLNCRINCNDKISQVKYKRRHYVCDILTADFFGGEHYRNRPPESVAIYKKQRRLRKQCLCAMPADEITALPVSKIENKRGQQIDDRKRQSGNDCDQRHQVTVRRLFGLMLSGLVCKLSCRHSPLLIFQIQLINTIAAKGIITRGR